jgi:hypothetical protein
MRRTGEGGMLWPRVNCDVNRAREGAPSRLRARIQDSAVRGCLGAGAFCGAFKRPAVALPTEGDTRRSARSQRRTSHVVVLPR